MEGLVIFMVVIAFFMVVIAAKWWRLARHAKDLPTDDEWEDRNWKAHR